MNHELPSLNVALLTIGNEVTSGQIINTNSGWLANEISNLGLTVNCHLSVEDVEGQIMDALDYLSRQHKFIVITGGLGPTRDDLTRDAVAKWAKRSLQFDQPSWQAICDRLNRFGVTIAESNRRQCEFPQSAKILSNRMGTANAFRLDHGEQIIYCLPGPPKEILAIWQDHLQQDLTSFVPDDYGTKLFRLHCLGISESALGEIVEEVIAGSTLQSGYRPHIPYVEVKLWSPKTNLVKNEPYLQRLRERLSEWLIGEDDDDLAKRLLETFPRFDDIQIFDQGSQGILAERLGTAFRQEGKLQNRIEFNLFNHWDDQQYDQGWVTKTLELSEPESLTLVLGNLLGNGSWALGISYNGFMHSKTLQLPLRLSDSRNSERFKRFMTEISLQYWFQVIEREFTSRGSDD